MMKIKWILLRILILIVISSSNVLEIFKKIKMSIKPLS